MTCSSPVRPAVSTALAAPIHLDHFEMQRVRYSARQLVRTRLFGSDDIDDLASELLVEVYRALPRFDPTRASRHTFICRVLSHRRGSLIRDARRRLRESTSLEPTVADQTDRDLRLRLSGHTPIDPRTYAERAQAVGRAIQRLPARLRPIAEALKHHTQAEAARLLGVSETAINRARHQIRERFTRIGRANLF